MPLPQDSAGHEPRAAPVRVMIAVPFGRGGKGGIDRIMDALEAEVRERREPASPDIVATRGGGPLVFAPLHMARFLTTLAMRRACGTVDVVHINVAQHGSVVRKALIGRACHRLGVPYIVHVHGSQFHHYWEGTAGTARARIEQLICDAARVVVLGTFWRDFLIRMGTDPAKILIVPNASRVPTETVIGTGGATRFLFLGRMGERKGTPQLIEALGRLRDIPGWQAVLAGDGEVEQARMRIEELGIADRVEVRGWAGPDEVGAMLGSSDCLVLPSFNENLPMSVIEGMAHSLAVVTTPVGAVPDIIAEGETGLLVKPGDVDGLAVALRRIVEEPGLRAALGTAARAFHASNLDMAVYARRMTDVWTEAARSKGRK